MEPTELRKQFFAEVHRDPYAAMIQRMWADAWTRGYEQALRDAAASLAPDGRERVEDLRLSKSYSDRHVEALAYLTNDRRRAEAEMVIALAQLGPLAMPGTREGKP